MQFLLYEVLHVERLLARPRYEHHSRQTFNEVLETARTLAETHFADHYAKADSETPVFERGVVRQIGHTKRAWSAFADAGFFAAKYDFDEGGIQLPEPVLRAAVSYFCAANVATSGYMLLTAAAIDLLHTFGSASQKARYLRPMMVGRFAGTMAMTEPSQGSSLADLATTAEYAGDGTYRIRGRKIFISGGEQAITENIVHLVLARVKGAPSGTRGISLFVCPKYVVNEDGSLGNRNEVRLMGLLPKMGYHNTTSALLAFGDTDGAVACLIGEEHQGLKYMFHMMHQARIAVGIGAAALAYQGFNYSLAYARERRQGRLPSNRDPGSPQVRIVQHADVRRMLLAQKSYAEGALALCLFAALLQEESITGDSQQAKDDANAVLDLLTPVVKSWPSKYGVRSNDLAIQTLGGAGYTREHPVEQFYRDQRLNPIHEGVEAVHALDLLKRQVRSKDRHAFTLFVDRVRLDVQKALAVPSLSSMSRAMANALNSLTETTDVLLQVIDGDMDVGLANATLYLNVFGHVAVGWVWLQQATCATERLEPSALTEDDRNFYLGKVQAARYFIEWELPEIFAQVDLLKSVNTVCFDMQDAWF